MQVQRPTPRDIAALFTIFYVVVVVVSLITEGVGTALFFGLVLAVVYAGIWLYSAFMRRLDAGRTFTPAELQSIKRLKTRLVLAFFVLYIGQFLIPARFQFQGLTQVVIWGVMTAMWFGGSHVLWSKGARSIAFGVLVFAFVCCLFFTASLLFYLGVLPEK